MRHGIQDNFCSRETREAIVEMKCKYCPNEAVEGYGHCMACGDNALSGNNPQLLSEIAKDVTKLNVQCKFCNKTMESHTSNEAWWHLIYLSEGKTYEEIYGEPILQCCRCGKDPLTRKEGVIYIRAKNSKDKWESLPICPVCWNKENPKKRYDDVE